MGERLKDKLVNAARGKVAANDKEKQLKLERKKKAAMFIHLLQRVKDGDGPATGNDGNNHDVGYL